jgi:hypothetical protein
MHISTIVAIADYKKLSKESKCKLHINIILNVLNKLTLKKTFLTSLQHLLQHSDGRSKAVRVHAMKSWVEFFTSVLGGDGWSASHPRHSTRGERSAVAL